MALFNMSATVHGWTRMLTCALSCGLVCACAWAQDWECWPPELPGDYYFRGESVTNTPGRQYLRTEIVSIESGAADVRMAIVHVPPANLPAPGNPLLLALHSLNHNAATMEEDHPDLIAAAAEKGVVLAFLNGSVNPDPPGGRVWYMFGDGPALLDLAYVEGAILWLQHFLPIDSKRTFVSGMSGGAGMTQRVAADRPNRVKAGAAFCLSTGMYNTANDVYWEIPTPAAPISMYLVRGGEDPLCPPHGTVNSDGYIWDTVTEHLEFWVTAAGGTMDQVTNEVVDPDTTRHTYVGSSALVQMTFVRSLGHEWPGAFDRPVLDWFLALPSDPAIQRDGTNVVITFPSGKLESAPHMTGPWEDVPGAASPYSTPATEPQRFFRTRQ